MTATEHAQAILKATGSSLRHYTMPVTRTAILAAVEAAMQDARADERARIVGWLRDHAKFFANDEISRIHVAIETLAVAIEALAHKGTGDA